MLGRMASGAGGAVSSAVSSVRTKGVLGAARGTLGTHPYRRGAAAAAAVVGAGALMRRRSSGLDKTVGRPTGIRNY